MKGVLRYGAEYLYQWRKRKFKQHGVYRVLLKHSSDYLLRIDSYRIFMKIFKTAKRKIGRTKSKKTGGIKTKRRYTQELSTSVPKNHWDRAIWPTIRQYRLHLDNYTCQKCGKKKKPFFLRCHHRCYDRVDTEYEILDCITVCDKCHEEIHFPK